MSVRIALDTLAVNPLRTALSMLGVVIGVAALVAVLALGDGFEATMRRMAAADGRMQSVSVTPHVSDLIAGQRVLREHPPTFTVADAMTLSARLHSGGRATGVPHLLASGVGRPNTSGWRSGRSVAGISVIATTMPDDPSSSKLLEAGRSFTAGEIERGQAVTIVSDSLARLIAGNASDAIGLTLQLESTTLDIVGVLLPVIGDPRAGLLATIPISLSPSPFAPTATPPSPSFQIRAERVEDVALVETQASSWLASRFGEHWSDSATVQSYEHEASQGAQAIRLFKLFMGAITGISLVVGGIGIMNVLLASVTERTREIGIRRALGARRLQIHAQFLAESVMISLLGALMGTVLGIVAARITASIMRRRNTGDIHAAFSAPSIAIVATAAISVGLIFGVYPALRAARLQPVDALRHE